MPLMEKVTRNGDVIPNGDAGGDAIDDDLADEDERQKPVKKVPEVSRVHFDHDECFAQSMLSFLFSTF